MASTFLRPVVGFFLIMVWGLGLVWARDGGGLNRIDLGGSELADAIRLYTQEERSLERNFKSELYPRHREAQSHLVRVWQQRLEETDFDSLSPAGRVDFLLFERYLKRRAHELKREQDRYDRVVKKVPGMNALVELAQERLLMKWASPEKAAATLNDAVRAMGAGDSALLDFWSLYGSDIETVVDDWHRFYSGFDPQFDWWIEAPWGLLRKAMTELNERVRSTQPGDGLEGQKVGEAELKMMLANEMIPYSPQELIAIGRRELDWCVSQMRAVARQLGFGDDWRKALESVKERAVEPGRQPETVREMAIEAIRFLETNDLLTLPDVVKEDWHIEMLSARQQLMNPFFSGGDVISVAYPVRSMSFEQKRMSMRGNNPHFCWATVHHELIPGHHLQGYMERRHHAYRALFDTPFYVEGWPLYWEMKLWDLDFARGPEDRVGMLFWRMHRAARIVFSLSYHLGQMDAQECVDLLVNTVGHELENARAEVRRSFAGWYPPLYQCAYMLGGLQLRTLADEVVKSGKMSLKAFHDGVLQENNMPIALLRAKMLGLPIERAFRVDWRFYPNME